MLSKFHSEKWVNKCKWVSRNLVRLTCGLKIYVKVKSSFLSHFQGKDDFFMHSRFCATNVRLALGSQFVLQWPFLSMRYEREKEGTSHNLSVWFQFGTSFFPDSKAERKRPEFRPGVNFTIILKSSFCTSRFTVNVLEYGADGTV